MEPAPTIAAVVSGPVRRASSAATVPATRADVLPVAAGPAGGPALTRAQNILIGMAQTGASPVTTGAHIGG
jgi:hypothetical protein